jgi:hypothetical protein
MKSLLFLFGFTIFLPAYVEAKPIPIELKEGEVYSFTPGPIGQVGIPRNDTGGGYVILRLEGQRLELNKGSLVVAGNCPLGEGQKLHTYMVTPAIGPANLGGSIQIKKISPTSDNVLVEFRGEPQKEKDSKHFCKDGLFLVNREILKIVKREWLNAQKANQAKVTDSAVAQRKSLDAIDPTLKKAAVEYLRPRKPAAQEDGSDETSPEYNGAHSPTK